MIKEEWLINEVNKWQDDNVIDQDIGEKIKNQYEIYRSFNVNIFSILFSILGGTLIISGIGLVTFYNWEVLPAIGKLVVAVAPLIISYVMSIITILFKPNNKIWKEASAFLNTVSMFLALALIIVGFHFMMSLSNYLIICSLLTIPVVYIMQAISPLVIYYGAILLWGSLNISFGIAPILFVLFCLGTGLIFINIKKYNKTFKYNSIISALAGLPFMILFIKMLNGDIVLGIFLYSTLLFAARDIKKSYLPFKQIALIVSLIGLIYITTSHAWTMYDGTFGGITLGILTGLILLASLAIEVFNTKENNYEFFYLLVLMVLSIIRYISGCLHTTSVVLQMVFMALGIAATLLVALGFVSLGKAKKRIGIAVIGFLLIGLSLVIKIFETNLFFVGRAVAFLILGSIFLILVIFLSSRNESVEEKEEMTEGDTNEEANSNS